MSRLKELHAQRRHVLILGPAGIGKSALLARLHGQLPLLGAETQALVEATVRRGLIPSKTRGIVRWLHRRSAGSPLVLREFYQELANRDYDLSNPLALRRLDLDWRIHELFPALEV
ncbi:MAG: hypothetical protein KA118_00410 [Verrucomicrobia bacterium]|nr:hypothetical protein [Verrucomicrobiota bacterium]